MNKAVLTHVAVGVAGAGIGFGIGYLLRKKLYDRAVVKNDEHWDRVIKAANEQQDAVITSDEPIQTPLDVDAADVGTPIYDAVKADTGPVNVVDEASEMEPGEEIQPDFPDAPETTDEFTVEGQYPAIDAKAFIEQFRDRALGDFGGVSFPGKIDSETGDAEDVDIPVKSVPDFVTVRDPQGPYVISIDEFMDPNTDPPFTKVEMTWYSGDNVVVDSRNDQVPMSTVGQQNTLRFGEGTTDPNQVYLRNERLSIDIELTREDGMYLHAVLGQDYPDKTPVLRMRERDDG